jgi:hypothetical protein
MDIITAKIMSYKLAHHEDLWIPAKHSVFIYRLLNAMEEMT